MTSRDPIRFAANRGCRFSPPGDGFEVLYLAAYPSTCLWEVFGDEIFGGRNALSLAAWHARSVTEVRVAGIKVCNTNATPVRMAMGCDLAAVVHNDLSIPQAWARAIQSHPAKFEGLLYASRFTRKRCLALFAPPVDPKMPKPMTRTPLTEHPVALQFLADNRIALV